MLWGNIKINEFYTDGETDALHFELLAGGDERVLNTSSNSMGGCAEFM